MAALRAAVGICGVRVKHTFLHYGAERSGGGKNQRVLFRGTFFGSCIRYDNLRRKTGRPVLGCSCHYACQHLFYGKRYSGTEAQRSEFLKQHAANSFLPVGGALFVCMAVQSFPTRVPDCGLTGTAVLRCGSGGKTPTCRRAEPRSLPRDGRYYRQALYSIRANLLR